LNFTSDYSDFCANIKKYSGFVIKCVLDNGEETIQVIVHNDKMNRERIDQCMKLCGVYFSCDNIYDNGYALLAYEKLHENKINQIVSNKKYIYHLTLDQKLEKIKKYGLLTKANNKLSKHPERIYFFLEEPNVIVCGEMIKQMYGFEKLNNCSIVVVKTEGLNNDFYYDPNCENAVYTDEYIPKSNIEKINKIEIKTQKIK